MGVTRLTGSVQMNLRQEYLEVFLVCSFVCSYWFVAYFLQFLPLEARLPLG